MKKTILLGLSVMLFWSCNNAGTTNTENVEAAAENHTEAHYNESSEPLSLNDGEKWIVNEEMKPFVAGGEELVNTYIETDQSDYKALAEELKEQNNLLVVNCTMTGTSHDELHKWLHPHMEMVKALGDESDAAKADQKVAEIRDSYKQYHEYFN